MHGDTYVLCVTYCVSYTMSRTAQDSEAALFDNLKGELRRGYLIASVLAALKVEQYGYSLRKRLADQGLDVDEGTLYPLLRRLETQGLLASEWREEGKRNKRFYRLSPIRAPRCWASCSTSGGALDAALNGILRESSRWTSLERYLQAVRFFLPRRQQDDIVRELSENLASEIEDRERDARPAAVPRTSWPTSCAGTAIRCWSPAAMRRASS